MKEATAVSRKALQDEHKNLLQTLKVADRMHSYGLSEMHDSEYDAGVRRIIELEKLLRIGPSDFSKRIGYEHHISPDQSVTHNVIMPSLKNKTNSLDELIKWAEAGDEDDTFYIYPKYDGIALSLIYEDGHLVEAATRGDGYTGRCVLHAARMIRNIPLFLEMLSQYEKYEVRGEVVVPIPTFKEIQENSSFKTPRNYVAGMMNSKHALDLKYAGLVFKPYAHSRIHWDHEAVTRKVPNPADLVYGDCPYLTYRNESWQSPNVASLVKFLRRTDGSHYTVPTDGHIVHRNQQPQVSLENPNIIAFKYPNEGGRTKLNRVSWQVGRTGMLNPVGHVDPVYVNGVMIKRVTLHNIDFIKKLNLRITDDIFLERAGDVIPKLTENLSKDEPKGSDYYVGSPLFCPECYDPLCENRCLNDVCPGRVTQWLLHWCHAIGVKGMGPATAHYLVTAWEMQTPADLYKHSEAIFYDAAVSPALAESIRTRTAAASLDQVIHGLGLDFVGAATAKKLADHFGTLENLRDAKLEELEALEGVGAVTAMVIAVSLKSPAINRAIDTLKVAGIETKMSAKTGITFCITGTLSRPRIYWKERGEAIGMRFSNSLTKAVDLLVVGDDAGRTKAEKAKRYGTHVIMEGGFENMLEDLERQLIGSSIT